jgi:hypothetical protein
VAVTSFPRVVTMTQNNFIWTKIFHTDKKTLFSWDKIDSGHRDDSVQLGQIRSHTTSNKEQTKVAFEKKNLLVYCQ